MLILGVSVSSVLPPTPTKLNYNSVQRAVGLSFRNLTNVSQVLTLCKALFEVVDILQF